MKKPYTIGFCGIDGAGKTTQLNKLQVYYSENKSLVVVSFNLHRDAFTIPFNIRVWGAKNVVTVWEILALIDG